MDDNNRNLILATVLSFLVILIWYTVFAPEPPAPTEPAQPVAQQGTGAQPAAPEATGDATATADLSAQAVPAADRAGRVQIDSPALAGSISLAGGRIDDLSLLKYQETLDPSSPNVRLLAPSSARPTWALKGAKSSRPSPTS
mgnify:CR=1 FL=1